MWECNYAREPINYRLFFLKLLKKIWVLPLAAVVGAIVIGGVYYVINMVIGDGYQYQARTVYYVKYATDSTGAEADYYNYYTWQELLDTEYFVDGMYEAMGGTLDKEYIVEKTTATIEADYRYLYSKSVSGDIQQSIEMESKLAELVVGYAELRDEIESIEVVDKAGEMSIEDVSLIYVGHSAVVGAVIGFVVAILGFIFMECADTSIYIPGTLEKRYHVMALGASSMKEFDINCKEVLGGKQTAVIAVDDMAVDEVKKAFPAEYKIEIVKNPIDDSNVIPAIKEKECIVLALKAGAHNGTKIERTLEELGRLGVEVSAFALLNEDKWLIKKYYR